MQSVGDSGDTVEVGQYREINKGGLKASFTLIEHSAGRYKKSRRTLNCKLFSSGQRRWFAFPSQEITKNNEKSYLNLVSILDKTYEDMLQKAVLAEIDSLNPVEANKQDEVFF